LNAYIDFQHHADVRSSHDTPPGTTIELISTASGDACFMGTSSCTWPLSPRRDLITSDSARVRGFPHKRSTNVRVSRLTSYTHTHFESPRVYANSLYDTQWKSGGVLPLLCRNVRVCQCSNRPYFIQEHWHHRELTCLVSPQRQN